MNSVQVMGNLTKDVELRHTQAGKAVAKLTVAVNQKYRTPTGEEREISDFIPVVIWGTQADAAAQELRKGSRVWVMGKYKTRSYEAQDGTKRYTTEVVADIVAKPLGVKQQTQNGGGGFSRFGAPSAPQTPQAQAYQQEDIPF